MRPGATLKPNVYHFLLGVDKTNLGLKILDKGDD